MTTETGVNLAKAKSFLESGELVGIPTETVYGLAGNAFDVNAVLKIFEVKERPIFDPLIVHVPDIEMVMKCVVDIPALAADLIASFWPGPLTIIFKKKNCIPDLVTSGLDTVGMRMPLHPLTLELLQDLQFPLAAPSANPFGYISPTSAQHVIDQLGNKIPYILDGGNCSIGLESTIIEIKEKTCFVYRLGGLTLEDLKKVANKVELRINSSSNPKAPGMLKNHYAPTKPFYIADINEVSFKYPDKKIAYLFFTKSNTAYFQNVESIALSTNQNLKEAAHSIFSLMRMLDGRNDIDIIVAETVPEIGIGRAINDRMRRAVTGI